MRKKEWHREEGNPSQHEEEPLMRPLRPVASNESYGQIPNWLDQREHEEREENVESRAFKRDGEAGD
jgi:hypothetical protein